jgi:hypothetical protein
MPLNVQLNKSTPSNFRLVFPLLPNQVAINASEELILNIHGTILPGVGLEPGETNWHQSKSKIAMGPMMFDEFSIEFIVDTEFKNWQVIWNWMNYITNYKTKLLEKYREFSVDGSLQILNNFNSEILRISFVRMWPVNLGAVTLSNRNGESIIECSATFSYDYFEIK